MALDNKSLFYGHRIQCADVGKLDYLLIMLSGAVGRHGKLAKEWKKHTY